VIREREASIGPGLVFLNPVDKTAFFSYRCGQGHYLEGGRPMHKPSLKSVLIGLIPFVAMCFTVVLWDQVHPFVLGLPFNIFWIILWILITPIIMSFAYRSERTDIDAKESALKGGA
jgi:hypothetical protein